VQSRVRLDEDRDLPLTLEAGDDPGFLIRQH
jgi:hypothetical protein